MSLTADRRDWEALGRVDPLWAVATDPARRGGRWDPEEFFATGRAEVDAALGYAQRFGLPREHGRALDFGCGAGRLTRALAAHVAEVVGVDLSESMVQTARRLNAGVPNARFAVNTDPDLRAFADTSFDVVYSTIALQHVSDAAAIRAYLREFVRILRPGGLLMFQLPTSVPWRVRAHPRKWAYRALRRAGVGERLLVGRLGLFSMTLNALPEAEVTALLRECGAEVADIAADERTGSAAIPSRTYTATR